MEILVVCRDLPPKMNLRFFPTFALLLFVKSVFSQQNIPVVKANYDYVTVRWDKQLLQYSWQITPKEKLDIYPTSAKKLTFYTDIDSISFVIDPDVGKYDFAFVLHGKDTAHTEIRYDAAAKPVRAATAMDLRYAIESKVFAEKITPQEVYRVENRAVWNGTDSIRIRIYYPNNNRRQRIIYNIHGGAFVACNLDTHDNISRLLANKTASIVVALDYRKPPEYPYPATPDDILTVLNWIKNNAESFGGDKNNMVWVGDSGGGLQATALGIKLRKEGRPKAIVLINPAEDLRHYEQSQLALACDAYLAGKDASDSLVSPLVAQDFSFFPPTLVITSELDYLKQQGVAIYAKLKAAGVKAKTVDIPKMGHLAGYWAEGHPNADVALVETVQFILEESPQSK
jgi:acetyl esterase